MPDSCRHTKSVATDRPNLLITRRVPSWFLPICMSLDKRFSRRELLCGAAYALILFWINAYVCRDLLTHPLSFMNSMHGFWIALAKRAGSSWFYPSWWPYWDCGIPFEFTYAPLVPGLTAAWAALRGIPHALSFQYITAISYCLGPVTLYLMAWLLTRAPGYSFIAGLAYSLTAPTQLLVPDGPFAFARFWDARRMFLMATWDETPHMTAVVFLPLAILFLSLSIRKHQPIYYTAAALSIALMTLASAFGPTMMTMAALCLLFVHGRADYKRNIGITILIGAVAYAIASPFLSPTLVKAIRAASANSFEGQWSMGSVTAIAMIAFGWAVLWRYLSRWTADWRLQFFALFAYLTSSIPILIEYFHRQFLPQPTRYKVEMEFALALLLVFGLRYWFQKLSPAAKIALVALILALAGEQTLGFRRYAKNLLVPTDVSRTIEYRTATWAEQNLPGVRVFLPGSIAQWANAFTEIQQFGGGSWSAAASQIQQRGVAALYNGGPTPELDSRISLAWLKAFGVGAVAVSGPKSQEFWKPFAHPTKFEGVLPVLWREDDVTIYQVPQRTTSLAHVVPESAIVSRSPAAPADTVRMEPYIAALDDPALPTAQLQWRGRNGMRISTSARPGQVISVQVSHHPGWRVKVNGQRRVLRRDALGLMWFKPECNGPCEAELEYNGGWELRICRFISYAALAALFAYLLVGPLRRRMARVDGRGMQD